MREPHLILSSLPPLPFASLPIPIESRCQVSRHAEGLHGPREILKDLCCSAALIWPTECPRYPAHGIDGPLQRSKIRKEVGCAQQLLASSIGSF